jgi:hypothetical protein
MEEKQTDLAEVFTKLQAKALASQLLSIEEMLNERLDEMEDEQEKRLDRLESKLDRFGLPQPIMIDNRDKVAPYPM